ncbi:MAG TPA: hypothetical protein GXX75_07135 [Clostridiales bacterium]|nr:hypothetical protein [Clostridiales bacterium]
MNKKFQLKLSFILLLICISAIVYSIHFRREENERISDKNVNIILLENKHIKNADVYDTFLNNFNCQGKAYYYSFIELVGYDYPILLLSDGVYNKDGCKVAMGTDIYYPVNNEITIFGKIGSNGTAYPISANTTGIFTAGGHEVTKYGLDIQNRKLKLINKYIMFFYTIGEEVNVITIGFIGDESKIVSEGEFYKANKEYGNANIIYFKRLC